MGGINQWVTGVICCSLVIAVADSLTPKGSVKQVVRMIGGLILLIVIVNPLVKLETEELAWVVGYEGATLQELEQVNDDLLKTIIETDVMAYIQDKVSDLGGECWHVGVVCSYDENQLLRPWSVQVQGVLTEGQISELSECIKVELDIPVARQEIMTLEGEL